MLMAYLSIEKYSVSKPKFIMYGEGKNLWSRGKIPFLTETG